MVEVRVECSYDIEVKQSKFLGFVVPVNELDQRLESLKSEHPKARHFIVAWRKLNAFEQVVEYSTDDGEPKGTSGRPVLNVLRGLELINSAVIIVRYFGGTKLGTGGLVRAYTDAAKEVLAKAELFAFELKSSLSFSVAYTDNQKIEHWLQIHDIVVKNKNFMNTMVDYTVDVSNEQKISLLDYEKGERLIEINKP